MRINAGVKNIKLNLDNYQQIIACTTAKRPTEKLLVGMCVFDTSLNKPIWWNGSNWVDYTGTRV